MSNLVHLLVGIRLTIKCTVYTIKKYIEGNFVHVRNYVQINELEEL